MKNQITTRLQITFLSHALFALFFHDYPLDRAIQANGR
jgi:hypothetical protein